MANLTGKLVFKILLIIAVIIQPIANTYAMVNMDHAQHLKSITVEQHHDGHHAMSQGVSDVQHDSHKHDDNSMSDCCDTSACCPAAIVGFNTLAHIPVTFFSTHLYISLQGVTLSSEIKPPQRIFT